jgi:hypothetical protein
MVTFIRTVVFVSLAAVLLHPLESHARQTVGKLRGIVVDLNYARVAGQTITFEGDSFKKYVRTDEAGAYEVELPEGACLVEVISQGFLPRRVKFNVEAGATKTLNMILDVEPMKYAKCPKGRICIFL